MPQVLSTFKFIHFSWPQRLLPGAVALETDTGPIPAELSQVGRLRKEADGIHSFVVQRGREGDQ